MIFSGNNLIFIGVVFSMALLLLDFAMLVINKPSKSIDFIRSSAYLVLTVFISVELFDGLGDGGTLSVSFWNKEVIFTKHTLFLVIPLFLYLFAILRTVSSKKNIIFNSSELQFSSLFYIACHIGDINSLILVLFLKVSITLFLKVYEGKKGSRINGTLYCFFIVLLYSSGVQISSVLVNTLLLLPFVSYLLFVFPFSEDLKYETLFEFFTGIIIFLISSEVISSLFLDANIIGSFILFVSFIKILPLLYTKDLNEFLIKNLEFTSLVSVSFYFGLGIESGIYLIISLVVSFVFVSLVLNEVFGLLKLDTNIYKNTYCSVMPPSLFYSLVFTLIIGLGTIFSSNFFLGSYLVQQVESSSNTLMYIICLLAFSIIPTLAFFKLLFVYISKPKKTHKVVDNISPGSISIISISLIALLIMGIFTIPPNFSESLAFLFPSYFGYSLGEINLEQVRGLNFCLFLFFILQMLSIGISYLLTYYPKGNQLLTDVNYRFYQKINSLIVFEVELFKKHIYPLLEKILLVVDYSFKLIVDTPAKVLPSMLYNTGVFVTSIKPQSLDSKLVYLVLGILLVSIYLFNHIGGL